MLRLLWLSALAAIGLAAVEARAQQVKVPRRFNRWWLPLLLPFAL